MKLNILLIVSIIFSQESFQMNNNVEFQKALSFEKSGKIKEAIQVYKKILEINPNHQTAFFQLKNLFINNNDNVAGIQLLSKWIDSNPKDLQSTLLLSELYFRNNQKEKSETIWSNFESNYLTNKTTYRLLFYTYTKFGQVDKMEGLALKGRERLNEPYLFAIDLANYFQARQTYDRALKEYIVLINYQKQYNQFVTDRILIMSDDKSSHSMIESALKTTSKSINEAKIILAAFYFKTGRYIESYDENTKIITSDQNDIKRWINFASNLRKEKQYNISIKSYHYLLQNYSVTSPDILGGALLGLGESYESQINESQRKLKYIDWFSDNNFFEKKLIGSKSFRENSFLNTIEHYQSVLTLLPPSQTTAIIHFRLGEIQANILDDYKGALISYNAALNSFPSDILKKEINLKIGKLLLLSGELKKSLDYFESNKKKQINEGSIHYFNSMIYQGMIVESKSFLDSIIFNLDPSHSFFNDFLEMQNLIINYYSNGTKSDKIAFKIFYEAESLINQNKIDEAIKKLQKINDQYSDALIAPLSTLRLSLIFLAINNPEKAQALAQSIIDTPLKDHALILNGEIEEIYNNEIDNALNYYNRLLKECNDSLFTEPIRIHIRNILKSNET